ncbi:hypothetical protein FI667_g8622, partial [Globisporangium splendens]
MAMAQPNWPSKAPLPSLFKTEHQITLRPLVSVNHHHYHQRMPSPAMARPQSRHDDQSPPFYHRQHSYEAHRAYSSSTHEQPFIKSEPPSYNGYDAPQQQYKLPVLAAMLHKGARHGSPQRENASVPAFTPKSSLSFILDVQHAQAAKPEYGQPEDADHQSRASISSTASSLMSEEDEAYMNRYIDQHEIMGYDAPYHHHHQLHHHSRIKINGKRRAIRPASRTCKYEGCDQYVVDHGLCVRHGGGKRCMTEGCTSRAKHFGRCWRHGGSMECKVTGCVNRAKSRGFCWSHGGGTKCKSDPCEKIAISNGLCWAHGGGKRCIVEDCMKQAYERTQNYCNSHFQQWKLGHNLPLASA